MVIEDEYYLRYPAEDMFEARDICHMEADIEASRIYRDEQRLADGEWILP